MALPHCPACEHDGVRSIAELTAVPVFCNALWDDRDQARSAPVGDLDLVLCERCGLLWNRSFDEALTAYSPAYENSLHFSPAFQTFAKSLAEDLVQRYDLHDTSVVEIGAGSGDFLAMVCELGSNRGIGYDPSHDPARAVPGPVEVVAEHYPIDRPIDARLVCSRHVLEHVTEPIPLLEGVRGSLDPALDTVVYLEVPDATFMLEQPAVWDLIYEHCTYFSEPTLNALCARAGFKTLRSGRSFGDQYLWVEAGAGEPRTEYPSPDELAALIGAAEGFGDHLRSMIADWDQRLDRMAQDGPVAVWGAGSKGVSFLSLVAHPATVGHVVDVNPHKAGKYLPASGLQVQTPDSLPDDLAHVLVMNPIYLDEISGSVRDLGLDAQVTPVA